MDSFTSCSVLLVLAILLLRTMLDIICVKMMPKSSRALASHLPFHLWSISQAFCIWFRCGWLTINSSSALAEQNSCSARNTASANEYWLVISLSLGNLLIQACLSAWTLGIISLNLVSFSKHIDSIILLTTESDASSPPQHSFLWLMPCYPVDWTIATCSTMECPHRTFTANREFKTL